LRQSARPIIGPFVKPVISVKIILNSQALDVAEGAVLAQLLNQLGLAGRPGMAVAVNDAVVPRARWDQHALLPGDAVLLIQATQGG